MVECKNCGTVFTEDVPAVCPACGTSLVAEDVAPIVESVPVSLENNSVGTVYGTEVRKPARNKGALVMAIVGMGLGIEGLIGLYFTIFFSMGGFVDEFTAFVVVFVNLFYVVVFGGGSIAALILANKAALYGELSGMQKAAKITGLIGIIGHGAALALSLILAMVACANL